MRTNPTLWRQKMKTIFTILIGIATLIGGAVGSVATADDHKYEYVIAGINHTGRTMIRILTPSGRQATVDFKVTDQYNQDVGSNIPTLTLEPNFMRRVVRPAQLTGNGRNFFRTVRITSTEELWVYAGMGIAPQREIFPVFSRVVPTTPTTPEKTDDSCPGGAKTC